MPCETCRQGQLVQRAAAAAAPSVAPAPSAPTVASVLAGGGQALAPDIQQSMAPSFGRDLSGVRIHTGAAAAASAESLSARAYTVGDHIVFNRGEYQPHTRAGKHLLAHELAHTLQQAGVQRSAMNSSLSPASEAHLESEANRVADAVVQGRAAGPISRVGAGGPLLQRAPKEGLPPASAARAWGAKPAGLPASVAEVTPVFDLGGGSAQAFKMAEPFPLPPQKGQAALKLWKERAAAGALETIWNRGDKVGLYQGRDKTTELRATWLAKVGWPTDAKVATEKWNNFRSTVQGATPKTEPKDSEFKPRVADDTGNARTCHMDHVVELQMQGTNVASNVAVLDGSDNSSSGSKIAAYIAQTAGQIQDAVPGVEVIILHYERVEFATNDAPANGFCTKIEKAIADGAEAAPANAASDANKRQYELVAGGSKGVALIAKDKLGDHDISQENVAKLVPGLVLTNLSCTDNKKDTVSARFADKDEARIPITLVAGDAKPTGKKAAKTASGAPAIKLKVGDGQVLKLDDAANGSLHFHYPYLSNGKITKLELRDDGIAGEGELVPSIPLLNKLKLKVAFSPDHLEVIAGLKDPKLHLPIPGFKITRADISLLLHPELKPTGIVAFVVDAGQKRVIEGALSVGADAQGFYAKGELKAFLPGVDDASGQFIYRKDGWEGSLHVEASKFKLPVPGMSVKAGAVDVRIGPKGLDAAGKVVVGLPGNQEAELGLEYRRGAWLFYGEGRFRVPPLESFVARVTYDGKRITASGDTTLAYRGFVASLKVAYDNGKISGRGKLDFQKGRVKGSADVEVDEYLKLSGKGSVALKLTDDMEAVAGIELAKTGKVRLTGALTILKPIILFKGYGSAINLFSLKKSMPVPGLSIGPLGVQAVLGASLDARYSIGPAALIGTTVTLALDPFDDKPDPDIGLKSSLSLPASAGISATITGGLELEAGLARAGGEIGVTGGANIAANAGADIAIRYYQKQLEVKGAAVLDAGLLLTLGIKATVYGEVGVWKFKKRWTKSWQLYDKTFDTGLKFKLKAPFGYSSAGGAKLPSANDIEIVKPTLSLDAVLGKLIREARQEDKER